MLILTRVMYCFLQRFVIIMIHSLSITLMVSEEIQVFKLSPNQEKIFHDLKKSDMPSALRYYRFCKRAYLRYLKKWKKTQLDRM
jgi:hypothetical protein